MTITQDSDAAFDVDVPEGYFFESAEVMAQTDTCPGTQAAAFVPATDATGNVDFREGSGLPIIGLNFDVSVTFTHRQNVPESVQLQAQALGVTFCS